MQSPLVSTDWLNNHLTDENIIMLDASMSKVIGKEEIFYASFCCIPGALKFDLEQLFCDKSATLPNTMPNEQQFFSAIVQLGISEQHTVIIYDNQGIYSAPRAWWLLKSMGFEKVFVLDGGLPEWLNSNLPTNNEYGLSASHDVNVQYQGDIVCDYRQILQHLDNDTVQVIDARSSARFSGESVEPRTGVRAGHIPNSKNLPFQQVLANNNFKPKAQLQNIFSELVENKQHLVFTCGSGITACILYLAATIAGYENACVYDGSWSEWGSRIDLPVAVGH